MKNGALGAVFALWAALAAQASAWAGLECLMDLRVCRFCRKILFGCGLILGELRCFDALSAQSTHRQVRSARHAQAKPLAVGQGRNAHAFDEQVAQGLLSMEVDSWMTGVNINVAGRQVRRVARYTGSAPTYRGWANGIAERGYEGVALR